MTTTTSHGSPGSGAAVPPLRREVIVAADRDLAFRVFTERIGAWWPLAGHSVHSHDAASRVLVTFTTVDGGTLVRLEHSGWEAFGDRTPAARANYEQGWPIVLGAYADLVAS